MSWMYEDDYAIDERTGDLNIFSETYGYERKRRWEDDDDDSEWDTDTFSDDD